MPYHHSLRKAALKGLAEKIQARIYRTVAPLQTEVFLSPEPLPFSRREEGVRRSLSPGQSWGRLWDCGWFHFTAVMPSEARGLKTVLRIDISGEACAFGSDGLPLRGLTTYASEFDLSLGRPGKTEFPWAEVSEAGQPVELWCDGACNDLFGKYPDSGTLKLAEIAVVREDLKALYYDVEVLWDLLAQIPESKARHHHLVQALFEASTRLVSFDETEVAWARLLLAPELARAAGDSGLTLSAVGHAHIDLAWLWPLRETYRKTTRTFATALANLELYPDYVFGASQPQQYQWLKEQHPRLYQKIRPQVDAGRWEVQGGMWVEPDTNLVSGESLVRQLLYGIRFFQKEFGVTPRMLWLPDVFGYSGALPQILKKAGIGWFMTTKLSWNKFNTFPHHSFHWTGIDGSSVLAHMAPEGTYNSSAAPRAVASAEAQYLDKSVSERALLIFGIGDGGGGPGEEHLERLLRAKNLSGLVPVVQERAETFFERLSAEAESFAVYTGELYFEMHQGTYTSQARNKAWNRRLEEALGELEAVSVAAELEGGQAAPRARLEALWKEVLLYQFHDILPGSSIGRVYAESLERYAALWSEVQGLQNDCFAVLAQGGSNVFNPLPWNRTQWLKREGEWQLVEMPGLAVSAPPAIRCWAAGRRESSIVPAGFVLANDKVALRFTATGTVDSLVVVATGREYLAGEGRLMVWPDDGDAWDFSPDYRHRPPEFPALLEARFYSDGPLTGVLCRFGYRGSLIEQDCRLTAGSARVDFVTKVEWNERGRMLRAEFPTTVVSPVVECEIQFGSLFRSTGENTGWDSAQFEICGQRWVNLSEDGFGLALLNDSKYGYRAKGRTLDLNLLRSPSYPDPEADKGDHRFTYSLLPHGGTSDRLAVAREAAALNQPLRLVGSGRAETPGHSLVTLTPEHFRVDAVKFAEDGRAVVVRCHEMLGKAARLELSTGFPWSSVHLADLLENVLTAPEVSGDSRTVRVEAGPYEILTLRFEL